MHILDKVKKAIEQGFVYLDGHKITVSKFSVRLFSEYGWTIPQDRFELASQKTYTSDQIMNKYWHLPISVYTRVSNKARDSFNKCGSGKIEVAMGYKEISNGVWIEDESGTAIH